MAPISTLNIVTGKIPVIYLRAGRHRVSPAFPPAGPLTSVSGVTLPRNTDTSISRKRHTP